jgi:hypothetical protein
MCSQWSLESCNLPALACLFRASVNT